MTTVASTPSVKKNDTTAMFARYFDVQSQPLPQCCKYLADEITMYLLHLKGASVDDVANMFTVDEVFLVDAHGFVQLKKRTVLFDINAVAQSTPDDLDMYVNLTRGANLTAHQIRLFKLLVRDRWYKGDHVRMKKMLIQPNVDNLVSFACNVLWERGYENHYTLGQQLSIRITTKLIQSGLDFKHQQQNATATAINRGWNDVAFEKFLASFTSISDVIKRHRFSTKYIVFELEPHHSVELKRLLAAEFCIIENCHLPNLCATQLDDDKNSLQYCRKLQQLLVNKYINVLFVTDVEYYLKEGHYMFYLYNSLKLYYYCLRNQFVFHECDYEMIFLLNLIISLEWCNKGHLNSFTLEKSLIYNPLELSTRRLNSLKRAAVQSRIVHNDSEIKMDFIHGKRIKTGTHYGHRIVQLE
uniref:p47 n=1 Tax=Helicoverpa armigera nucleopolyhedrovirus TaxID=51313 RepID=A0A482ER07_9ABAC|nr:p47 [Helicoverpa armigera nucleopolyhedrovirus]